MRRSTATILGLAIASALTGPAGAAAPDFDGRVAPILARRCLDCHSGPEPKGGLDLSRRASQTVGSNCAAY